MLAIPADLKSTRLLVLAWTDHWFGADYLDAKRIENPNGPDIELTFTTDRDQLDGVDAVWFHGPSITDLPPRKRQPWVLMSMESDLNYPALKNPMMLLRFDLLMTYRLDADVPCIYPNWHQYGTFLDPPPTRSGPSSGALAVYIASNPVPHRDAYVAELMRHVPIDSLGSCLRNASIDGFVTGGRNEGAWASLLSVLPRYKFYLAFLNSITTDYVTERVFHALACGVVPIYLGARNVRDFMPADDAIIDASDFASPRELADYLRYLDHDAAAYAKHLRWKHEGYSDRFKALLDLGSIDPQRRMAVKLAHGCDRTCRCGGRLREPGALP
jgi:hypothetical protein